MLNLSTRNKRAWMQILPFKCFFECTILNSFPILSLKASRIKNLWTGPLLSHIIIDAAIFTNTNLYFTPETRFTLSTCGWVMKNNTLYWSCPEVIQLDFTLCNICVHATPSCRRLMARPDLMLSIIVKAKLQTGSNWVWYNFPTTFWGWYNYNTHID